MTPKGHRITFGIPGSGLSWTEYEPHANARQRSTAQQVLSAPSPPKTSWNGFIILVVATIPIGTYMLIGVDQPIKNATIDTIDEPDRINALTSRVVPTNRGQVLTHEPAQRAFTLEETKPTKLLDVSVPLPRPRPRNMPRPDQLPRGH